MKMKSVLAAFAVAMVALVGSLIAADKEEFKATCPVSGAPAKEANYVEYMGKKVYFCCMNCPKKFKADPASFAAKANKQLAETKQITQVACPVSGQACNPEQKSDIAGVEVCFCCEKCKAKADGSSDAVAMIFGTLDKGFTLQTACPVSGKKIDPSKSVEYKGKKVYFCCGKCPDAFNQDPAKYTAKLPQLTESK